MSSEYLVFLLVFFITLFVSSSVWQTKLAVRQLSGAHKILLYRIVSYSKHIVDSIQHNKVTSPEVFVLYAIKCNSQIVNIQVKKSEFWKT